MIATAISPLTGPVDAVRLAVEDHYSVGEALWKVPLMIVLSPFVASLVGVGVDLEGKYDRNAAERVGRPWYHAPGH